MEFKGGAVITDPGGIYTHFMKISDLSEIRQKILKEIKDSEHEVECPDCKYMDSDDQYTCTTCWCEGGNGTISVYTFIKETFLD